jgi:ABC-2 type transport system permease protein
VRRRPVAAIVRKDVLHVLRNRGVRLPLLITPVLVLVVVPAALVLGADLLVTASPVPLEGLTGAAPGDGGSATGTDGLDPRGEWAVFVLEVFLAPLFLLIPLVVATVIAADSFAGERERGTLEALLHSPASDRELLVGKFLAAWLPALVVSFVGFAVYSLLANLLAWPSLGRVFFPTPTWLLLAFWVSPALAALGLSVMVVASSKVKSLQAAHQVGSLLVLPIVVLMVAQIAGLMLVDARWVASLGAVLWVASSGFLWLGSRTLRRERLALRL